MIVEFFVEGKEYVKKHKHNYKEERQKSEITKAKRHAYELLEESRFLKRLYFRFRHCIELGDRLKISINELMTLQ